MALAPSFASDPLIGKARVIDGANTTRDGSSTTNMLTVVTAGDNGCRISKIVVKAVSTTTAGLIRIWIGDASAVLDLLTEIVVDAVTPSATVPTFEETVLFSGDDVLVLLPDWTLRATTHNDEDFIVFAFGGNF